MDEPLPASTEPVTADAVTLVERVEIEGGYALVLSQPVFVRAGERYFVDIERSALIVLADGVERRFPGDMETVCR